MDTFKICAFRLISCFNQSFEASLHQSAYAAAENCLLTEQVCFGFFTEGGTKNACSCPADSQCIGQSEIICFSRSILSNRDQTGNALAGLIFASYGMSGSLRCDHGNINICGRLNLSEMDGEAMCEHKHHTGS